MKERLRAHIESKVFKTGHKYLTVMEVEKAFPGENIKPALNELRAEGLIRRCEGANLTLIEYLKDFEM